MIATSWIEFAIAGLPYIPPVHQVNPNNFAGPLGFPLRAHYCHFFNFLFVMMLIRKSLSILMSHPRLCFNRDCTPGSKRIRFKPLKVPGDRVWTAKGDARYISPLIGTPGYRHTVSVVRACNSSRSIYFLMMPGFVAFIVVPVTLIGETYRLRLRSHRPRAGFVR